MAAKTDLVLHALERGTFLTVVAGVPRSVEAADDYARRAYT